MAERLLGALSELSRTRSTFALVGGFAVMARVADAYRVTEDLDTVSADETFVDAVVARAGAEFTRNVLSIRGVPIDRIEVPAAVDWNAIEDLDEAIDRLFTSAHAWALEMAAPLRIRAGDLDVVVPVAELPALFASKLHAYSSPRRDPRKRHSDALDVVRLSQTLVRRPTPWVEGQPSVAVSALRWAVESALVAEPTTVVRRMRGVGPSAPPVGEEEVRALGGLLLDGLAL